ncbi:MAG: hypothetical protein WB341_18695 [Terracidiphilus sp.]
MTPRAIRPIIEISLCWGLLWPPAALLQSPGFGGGRLVIKSIPVGARILINDKQQQQVTDFTYVVGRGEYKVSVTGGPGNLQKCGDRQVQVASGNTVTVTCTANGWQ